MAKNMKEYDLSLLQTQDPRKALLQKMSQRLAGPSELNIKREANLHKIKKMKFASWGRQIVLSLLLVGVNILLISQKDVILKAIGVEGIPDLAGPSKLLSLDEQALYWTYALYDYEKLKAKYGVDERLVVDSRQAMANLEALLPRVHWATLGEVSKYAPVALPDAREGLAALGGK